MGSPSIIFSSRHKTVSAFVKIIVLLVISAELSNGDDFDVTLLYDAYNQDFKAWAQIEINDCLRSMRTTRSSRRHAVSQSPSHFNVIIDDNHWVTVVQIVT